MTQPDPTQPAEVTALPRQVRTRQRRDDIVANAANIFAREGYANVGMRDIADAVGIKGASLYHHFPSKEDILFAICLTVTQEPAEENLPLLDAAGTPTERLSSLVRAHLVHLNRRRVEYIVGLHELASLTPEHRTVIEDYRRQYQRRVRDVITAGMRSGEFTVPDARLASFALTDMLNGISNWFHDGGELSIEDVADNYVELAVHRVLGASHGN
ncbi:TetR family transcriptional regulator [Rhodococcus sp. 05-340-1]|uniref:TetR/AcrR family transcriptional regulator n=1 Tax=unclassified Rhodococcus (in: high G+C Gram-positive bacteria) TaxID=192944 RepID=UPI000B9B7E2F|nr:MULTISPECIES: TetR/AcrR family transcriptional regulator [unclassified Rhodococcus (in: high G+C Gram-positive bacteria)]OZD64242.1 TetR family transcriptional regulator [Rhodococcus sp. 05-340-2]OZD76677.1 TetR family transcriptional regulator [Rhodococcus sp. 05-340-1]